ncbi:F-box/kelch-repeat protein At3g06240-like [Abrus precatorius]|uniref:F-box/kelch-repeat protein At3g06240-like n=1 Tax=Abrus precatorius TaxID=3816 RepID=A0A8B8MM36_ABRPR|nr:F-box/kelch-repeat protein At3g06240-like [Abrus precatorius]
MKHIPSELLHEVLLRLPVKSLIRFKGVSKSWHSLISDPDFATSHCDKACAPTRKLLLLRSYTFHDVRSIDPDASLLHDSPSAPLDVNFLPAARGVNLVGSCRGLILLEHSKNLYLWNPFTGAHRLMPLSHAASITNSMVFPILCSFVYDPSTLDYSVVLVSYVPSEIHATTLVEVFSFKANTWKKIEATHLNYANGVDDVIRVGSLFNGAIHWVAFCLEKMEYLIVVFDLKEMTFSEISPPNELPWDYRFCELWVLGGFLSLWVVENNTTAIWVMEEYKVQSSWTKTLVVSFDQVPTKCFFPVCTAKNGDIVGSVDNTGLLKCDNEGQVKEQRSYWTDHHEFQVQVIEYTESLLSLPGPPEQAEEDD